MEHFITDFVLKYSYVAIFVLMVAESACIPILGLVGTAGNLVGSWIAYWAGRVGGRPLVERWGRYVRIRPHELDRAEAWFADHGEAAVFVSRLLPVVRTFISLPAGVAEMPLGKFTGYTVAGCLPWTFALAGVGYAVGGRWQTVEKYFRPISVAVAVILVGLIVWWFVKRRSRAGDAPGPKPGGQRSRGGARRDRHRTGTSPSAGQVLQAPRTSGTPRARR